MSIVWFNTLLLRDLLLEELKTSTCLNFKSVKKACFIFILTQCRTRHMSTVDMPCRWLFNT